MRLFARNASKSSSLPRSVIVTLLLMVLVAYRSVLPVAAESSTDAYLKEQIAKYSVIAQHADPPAMTAVDAGRIWTHLGTLYEEAGELESSEMAYLHALRLLAIAPVSQAERARAMDGLGTLYMMRGDTQQAERAELHALQIRTTEGLTAELPRSWYNLATLSLREHRTRRAQAYAQQAVNAIETMTPANPDDAMNAQFVLAMADCRMKRYLEAISIMQKAMSIVRTEYKPDEFPAGFGSFLLGYMYWRSGDTARADGLMKEGEATVEKQLGSEHPVTVTMQTQYERYLKNTHQPEAARAVEQELKQTRSFSGINQRSETLAVASLF